MPELIRYVVNAGPVARIVLGILALLSLISWAIIFDKIILFARVRRENRRLLKIYWQSTDWDEIGQTAASLNHSPHASVLSFLLRQYQRINHPEALSQTPQAFQTALQAPIVQAHIEEELARLDKALIFLATTVGVSPFLGLFGTVWGIMMAFIGMGIKGTADITAVGPGIAEALITTVAGLAVAIPVLFAYNLLVGKMRRFEQGLNTFAVEAWQRIAESHP